MKSFITRLFLITVLLVAVDASAQTYFTDSGSSGTEWNESSGSGLGPGAVPVYFDAQGAKRLDFIVSQTAPGGSVSFKVYASFDNVTSGASATYVDVTNEAFGGSSFSNPTKILLDTQYALSNASWIKIEFTFVTTTTGTYTIKTASEPWGA
jgi:hypothetical protein